MRLYTIQLAKWRTAQRMGVPLVDTTAKAGHHFFAPTWDIVMDHKAGRITDAQYTAKYYEQMLWSYNHNRQDWDEFLKRDEVAIACFCGSDKFCHRFLLADILQRLHKKLNLEFHPMGEIREIPPIATPAQA